MFPHVAQRESTHETTDHKTAPIEGEELARCLVVQTAQLGQTKIVNHSTAYTHFTADIHENSDHAEERRLRIHLKCPQITRVHANQVKPCIHSPLQLRLIMHFAQNIQPARTEIGRASC